MTARYDGSLNGIEPNMRATDHDLAVRVVRRYVARVVAKRLGREVPRRVDSGGVTEKFFDYVPKGTNKAEQ